jgi:glyoxylase-like metal-dependent hydrolase (beta-lactamase superfamily II)
VHTPFHLRERVFGDLKSVKHSASNPGRTGHEKERARPDVAAPTGPDPIAIDSMMFGEPELMAAHLLPGPKPCLIDPGPANTAAGLISELEAIGVDELDSIVLTHIHFDHAAGTSLLAERFPGATIYIHERVAGYLVEPSRLIEGVKSVWGDRTEQLFGLPGPVDEGRVVPLEDGSRIDLGDRSLEVIATPGHTRAHMAFLDDQTGALFCGDALGVQLPSSNVIRPSTPPSDFSLADMVASIARLSEAEAETVHLPHFGQSSTGPERIFDQSTESLSRWHESFLSNRDAAESDLDLQRRLNACVEASLEPVTPVTRKGFEAINPVWLNIAGMTAESERKLRRPAA